MTFKGSFSNFTKISILYAVGLSVTVDREKSAALNMYGFAAKNMYAGEFCVLFQQRHQQQKQKFSLANAGDYTDVQVAVPGGGERAKGDAPTLVPLIHDGGKVSSRKKPGGLSVGAYL